MNKHQNEMKNKFVGITFLSILIITLILVVTAAIFRNLHTEYGPVKSNSATSIYWGALAHDIAKFQTDAKKKVSIIQFGRGWWYQNSYVPFSPSDFDSVRQQGAIPMVD